MLGPAWLLWSDQLLLAEQALELLKVSPECVLEDTQSRAWGREQRRYLQFDESALEYVFQDNSRKFRPLLYFVYE
jgi:hypothetical protein